MPAAPLVRFLLKVLVIGQQQWAMLFRKKITLAPVTPSAGWADFLRFHPGPFRSPLEITGECFVWEGDRIGLDSSSWPPKNDLVFPPSHSRPAVTSTRKKQVPKKQTTSKILVRNIPFQANQREIRELFRWVPTLACGHSAPWRLGGCPGPD